jgi:predicted RNase H-like nuclease (RuvC/YqgF family)
LHFPNVLIHHVYSDPTIVIDAAARILYRNEKYNDLIIGIDPGKTYEIAVLGDRTILKTTKILGENEVALEVFKMLAQYEAFRKVIKIGDGAEPFRSKLVKILNQTLSHSVDIESVVEKGTTTNVKRLARSPRSKTNSAVMIASRKGKLITRTLI